MKKIVLATGNRGKVREMKEAFAEFPVEVASLAEYEGIEEPAEDGETFLENAGLKARYYAEATGCACVADDSGLEVQALGGAPGVHSARYAGIHGDDAANNAKVLEELGKLGLKESPAAYQCALVYAEPGGGLELTACGSCAGIFRGPSRGEGGFGYDPYFYLEQPPFAGRTMAELTLEEKDSLSHRGIALRRLVAEMRGIFETGRGDRDYEDRNSQ